MANDELLWLEVTNVRSTAGVPPGQTVEVQVKGDRSTPEPRWLPVEESIIGDKGYSVQDILRALDSKRLVLAGIGPDGGGFLVRMLRIQFADPSSR